MNYIVKTKFKVGDKVFYPRVTKENCLIDVREYYITNINIWINDREQVKIDYFASPHKTGRGKKFCDGLQLFHTYEEALAYCNF